MRRMEPPALNSLLLLQPPPPLAAVPSDLPHSSAAASATTANATAPVTSIAGIDGDAQVVAAAATARTFMLSTVLLMGSVCCALALTTCYRRRRELKSTASAFVVNLCVGDLLLCLMIAPALATDALARWRHAAAATEASAGELPARWCQIEGALATTLFVASSLNACAVSIDRYVAVRQSLRYASWFGRGTCNGIIASSWLVAVCVGAAPLLGRSMRAAEPEAILTSPRDGTARDFCDCVRSPLVDASRHENIAYAVCLTGVAFLAPLSVHIYVYLSIYQATKSTTALARRNSVQTPPQRGGCPSCDGVMRLQQQQQTRCICSSSAQSSQRRRHHHPHHHFLTGSRHNEQVGNPAALVSSPSPAQQQQQQLDVKATECSSADAGCALAECSGGHSRKSAASQGPRRPSWQMRLVHKDDRKAAKMGVMVVFSFVATWAPLYCLRVAEAISAGAAGDGEAAARYGWLAVVLALCDCVVNPFVYVLRSKRSLELLKCKARRPTLGRRIPNGGPKCFSISRAPNNSSKRLIEASDEYSGAEIYA